MARAGTSFLSDNKILSPTGIDVGGLFNINLSYTHMPKSSNYHRVENVVEQIHISTIEPLQDGKTDQDIKELLKKNGLYGFLRTTFITLHTACYRTAILWEVITGPNKFKVIPKMKLSGDNIAVLADPYVLYFIHQNSKKDGLRLNKKTFYKDHFINSHVAGTKSWKHLNFKDKGTNGNAVQINAALLQAYVREFENSTSMLEQYDIGQINGKKVIMSKISGRLVNYENSIPNGPFTFMAFGPGLNIENTQGLLC